MKGEMDRECRAGGGKITPHSGGMAATAKSFHSTMPKGDAPDATMKRGKGIYRKRGGKVPEGFEKHDKAEEREARKRGGKVEGEGKKPHLGRMGRKRGGGVGSDLNPLTSADKPKKAKDTHIMPESEATP